jgi:hypothetical protein
MNCIIKSKHYIRKESIKKGYILGNWLLGQQVLGAGITDILGIANIADIADVADIATYIADIATDIADIATDIADIVNIADIVDCCRYCRLDIVNVVVKTSRHIKSIIRIFYNSLIKLSTFFIVNLGYSKVS